MHQSSWKPKNCNRVVGFIWYSLRAFEQKWYRQDFGDLSRVLSGGKRGDYENCSVLYCVLKLHTVISTLR